MLDPVWRIVLIAAGAAMFMASFWFLYRDWKVVRPSVRAQALFYLAAVVVLIGLQPIRMGRMKYLEAIVLPSFAEPREQRLRDLRNEGWIIGAARPESLVDHDHALKPEIAARFQDYVRDVPQLLDPEAPSFVFVGREEAGWSRNQDTFIITLVFLGAVMILSGLRHLLRWTR